MFCFISKVNDRDIKYNEVFFVLDNLLNFICDWNTNAKHSFVSQTGKLIFIFIIKSSPFRQYS